MSTITLKTVINNKGVVYTYDASKYKSFKERYYENPHFRSQHLLKSKEKLNCPLCNKQITRSNMSKHKKTNMCKKKRVMYRYTLLLEQLKNNQVKLNKIN